MYEFANPVCQQFFSDGQGQVAARIIDTEAMVAICEIDTAVSYFMLNYILFPIFMEKYWTLCPYYTCEDLYRYFRTLFSSVQVKFKAHTQWAKLGICLQVVFLEGGLPTGVSASREGAPPNLSPWTERRFWKDYLPLRLVMICHLQLIASFSSHWFSTY